MRSMVCVFYTCAHPDLLRVDMPGQSGLDTFRRVDMSEIWSTSDTKRIASGTITLHIRMIESRTLMIFGVEDKLALLALLGATVVDSFIKSIHQAKKKTVPFYSRPVPILMVHEVSSEVQKSTSGIRLFIKKLNTVGDAFQQRPERYHGRLTSSPRYDARVFSFILPISSRRNRGKYPLGGGKKSCVHHG